jgi:hypothetical protein
MRVILKALTIVVVGLWATGLAAADNAARRQPVAEILGEKVYADQLATPHARGSAVDAIPPPGAASLRRARGESLRTRVWQAVFDDYARRHNIAATDAEIAAHVQYQQRQLASADAERARQRAALAKELKSPGLTATRRQQIQEHLNSLDRLAQFETGRSKELQDPAYRKLQEEAERAMAAPRVKQWKLDQALHREFGGRIGFRQNGWTPVDAYRRLLDQYETRKSFVVHDREMRAAVFAPLSEKYVYGDERKARFYYDKPYWERTPDEMKAAGF